MVLLRVEQGGGGRGTGGADAVCAGVRHARVTRSARRWRESPLVILRDLKCGRGMGDRLTTDRSSGIRVLQMNAIRMRINTGGGGNTWVYC